MKRRHILLACAWIALLGGCKTQEHVPPVLTVSAAECAAAPALAAAVALIFDGKETSTQSLDITADTPCLTDAQGRKRLFRLFRLPGGDIPYTVSVASRARGYTVFAPDITLLNAGGDTVREIAPDALMFRGGSLTGLFRPRPEEQYLLVASNPDTVGKDFSRTTQSMTAKMVPTGGGYFYAYSGRDRTTSYVFSHTGEIAVSLYPLPDPG